MSKPASALGAQEPGRQGTTPSVTVQQKPCPVTHPATQALHLHTLHHTLYYPPMSARAAG